MDVVGSEIGHKMRSAIKAKLTELGCYVDDELPDYVMVMVANKRTREQMEDDLQLFLGDNTELFVNWLHQVLKKLQEVTVAPAAKPIEPEKSKERSQSKDRKSKEKKAKEKVKKSDSKKTKKKEKEKVKLHRKKDEKKAHKSKKKSKHHEMIRPNVPPLLMNMEKDSEPSITDVFAGQILKNHGITIDMPKEDPKPEVKPVITEIKRPIVPIIDPATISSQPEPDSIEITDQASSQDNRSSVSSVSAPKEDQIDEINKIEAKIQGLKQKLAEQLDSMSDDEDFLNIRTEAEELMNDFAEDVFQEISQQAPPQVSPPKPKSPTPPPVSTAKPIEKPKDSQETLPQIELKLPKRPVRERLGAREVTNQPDPKEKAVLRIDSPERFTPEREPEFRSHTKSAKSRLGDPPETHKRISISEDTVPEKSDSSSKRLTSKVSVLENRPSRSSCASVVRVRPRPRVAAPANSLLLRAVADAHKSLLSIPPKIDAEPHTVKRALVLPMRRCVDAQKIVIQVPADAQADTGDTISLGDADSDDDKSSKITSDIDREEYIPAPLTKKITNKEYTPSRRSEGRTSTRKDDTLIIETINIHNPTVDKDKSTKFIVTMDGYHPNAFLAKKLLTEGVLNDDGPDKQSTQNEPKMIEKEIKTTENEPKITENIHEKEITHPESSPEKNNRKRSIASNPDETHNKRSSLEDNGQSITESVEDTRNCSNATENLQKPHKKRSSLTDSADTTVKKTEKSVEVSQNKRLSNTSDESDTQVIIKKEEERVGKRKSETIETPLVKKRKASPIVFDVDKKKDGERVRQRTESVSSDSQVTVTTITNTHKYDAVPSLSVAERKLVWCRAFPLCRFGAACAYAHPRCRFAAACTRRACAYAHAPALAPPAPAPAPAPAGPAPSVASHVVPVANYKTISTVTPNLCKYYPNCVNPLCHFHHPKPCRYGNSCANRLECNFYHADTPHKWRYPI